MGMSVQTVRGYALLDVASAMQKAIRRADARSAGYWAVELFESGYQQYLWRRLLTISAEDCWGCITHEIESLYRAWETIHKQKAGKGRIFAAKAVILLAQARKCRDADHLTNLVYDPQAIPEKQLEKDLDEARKHPEPIPDYAFDCHTKKGKMMGKTKGQFFREEFKALKPREKGLFDDLVD
jgi:replication-associated recombination protein RarA